MVEVNAQGRVVLPRDVRAELHLVEGSELVVSVEGGRLVLEAPANVLRRLQAVVRAGVPTEVDLVDDLTVERRTSAASESVP